MSISAAHAGKSVSGPQCEAPSGSPYSDALGRNSGRVTLQVNHLNTTDDYNADNISLSLTPAP